ncbi:MAG: hypothetical protein ACU4F9_10750 [Arcticibacter sp.]
MKNAFTVRSLSFMVVSTFVAATCLVGCKKDDDNSIIVPKANNTQNLRSFANGSSSANTVDKIAVEAQLKGSVDQRLSGLTSAPIVVKDTVNKLVYVDFGQGILGADSVTREGIIRLSYTDDYFTTGSVLNISFLNYKTDGKKMEGSRTITNMGINSNGNKYWQVEATNMKVWSADEQTWRQWNSSRTREMVGGSSTPEELSDDVYHISGTAEGSFNNGSLFTATFTDLVRESSCLWISSGVIEAVVDNSDNYFVDFGNGTCDNRVSVTYPDGTMEDLFLK